MDSFKLIENFGERLGITLGPNPDGVHLFEIDGLAFAIHDLDECSRIVLSGDLGHPPPEYREKLCVALLEAQHMRLVVAVKRTVKNSYLQLQLPTTTLPIPAY